MKRQNNDLLSADSSPKTLHAAGVKRVNNVPLMIVIGFFALFIIIVGLVAQKRANAQTKISQPIKHNLAKKDTLSMAYEVMGNRKSAPIETKANSEPALSDEPLQPSLTQTEKSEDQSLLDAELERIRQEKTQDFEEAVKAQSTIAVNHSSVSNRENSDAFKEKLQGLQDRQVLGGVENEDRWHLNSRLQNPTSRYEIRAGAVIPGVMISGISSELPGHIIGQVSQNVYDSATGKYLLIPQGTKLFGIYSSDVSFGQNSLLIAWQRLVFPDGKALDIGAMSGTDSAGYAGFRDQVDHHYARIYGSALLMSAVVAGITYSQTANQAPQAAYAQPTAGNVLSQALGQQLGDVTTELVRKNFNVAPTIHIRPGYRFNVMVTKDLVFKKPYRQFAY